MFRDRTLDLDFDFSANIQFDYCFISIGDPVSMI